jgi:hypothetical protein
METIAGVVSAVAAVVAVWFAWKAAQSSDDAAHAALETSQAATLARQADERARRREQLEGALLRIRAMRELESEVAPLDPRTNQFSYTDNPAPIRALQNLMVEFRAYGQILPLESLPKVLQLTKEGVRAPTDAARLHSQYLDCIEELGQALASLRAEAIEQG